MTGGQIAGLAILAAIVLGFSALAIAMEGVEFFLEFLGVVAICLAVAVAFTFGVYLLQGGAL